MIQKTMKKVVLNRPEPPVRPPLVVAQAFHIQAHGDLVHVLQQQLHRLITVYKLILTSPNAKNSSLIIFVFHCALDVVEKRGGDAF